MPECWCNPSRGRGAGGLRFWQKSHASVVGVELCSSDLSFVARFHGSAHFIALRNSQRGILAYSTRRRRQLPGESKCFEPSSRSFVYPPVLIFICFPFGNPGFFEQSMWFCVLFCFALCGQLFWPHRNIHRVRSPTPDVSILSPLRTFFISLSTLPPPPPPRRLKLTETLFLAY